MGDEATTSKEGCGRRLFGTGVFAGLGAAATGTTLPTALFLTSFFLIIGGMFISCMGAGPSPHPPNSLKEFLHAAFGPWAPVTVTMLLGSLLSFLPTILAAALAGLAVLLRSLGWARTALVPLTLSVAVGLTSLGACAVWTGFMSFAAISEEVSGP